MRCSGHSSGCLVHHVQKPPHPFRRISHRGFDRCRCNGRTFASPALAVLGLFASTSGFGPWCIDWRIQSLVPVTRKKKTRHPGSRNRRGEFLRKPLRDHAVRQNLPVMVSIPRGPGTTCQVDNPAPELFTEFLLSCLHVSCSRTDGGMIIKTLSGRRSQLFSRQFSPLLPM